MAARLRPLDVIWTHDGLISPPGPKMVVCLCPDAGLFVRINTKGWRPGSVSIKKLEHPFLNHDSHVECGAVFELDDYVIDQSVDPPGKGIIGRISLITIVNMVAAVNAATSVRDEDRDMIVTTLQAI